ncbi:MAG: zinc ribbon domain-containing protein [Nanoarchaeota archaeon]|nr:zinc ribbon domain-containing protein [Nanoarchaeota archaeon]
MPNNERGFGKKMPIYEYKVKPKYQGCEYCKDSFEIKQKITDSPLEECPKCQSPLEKIVSLFSFKINGYNAKNGYSRK